MKKWILRAAILLALFLASAGATFAIINRGQIVDVRQMETPTLPVLYMEVSDVFVNPMYGYASEMEEQYLRDGLTPITTDRDLTVVVAPQESTVESVSYRVSTADGSAVVETGLLGALEESGEYLTADFSLETPILMNQEYTLRFDVTLEGGDVYYYYTRVVQRAGITTAEYLDFALNFYQTCMEEDATELATYLEPDETETNSTYASLNIHSSFERITWGELQVALEVRAYPVIREINETTCSISMQYVISDTEEETVHYLNVTDFYRMRYSQSRVMLLDFERETQQLYDGENAELTSTGINLGITDRSVQYLSNQSADIVAFVMQGELWSYNRSANKVTRVFSFRSGSLDARSNLQEHDVKIVRVEESGDIDFVVYGYMNGDEHEGEVGIAVYHYGAELNQLEEELFIPMKTSFEYLRQDMEQLSYVSTANRLYLVLEGALYGIDVEDRTFEIIKDGMEADCLVTSTSQASIAWMDQMDENLSTSITVMDLETEESYQIQAGSGQRIKALGFMNEDLVYGLANDADIVSDSAGNVTFAMTTVRIASFGGSVLKEYQEDGVWVSGVELSEGLLELKRILKQDGVYVETSSDHIMNNQQKSEEKVELRLITTEREATQIGLDFEKSADADMLAITSNMLGETGTDRLSIDLERQDTQVYYVYAKGGLDSVWTKAAQAILRADEQMGVVLNRQQQYVWERGNRADTCTVNLSEVPEAVLAGTIDETALADALGEDYQVLNMTGCTLDSVLYQVGKGNAVVVKISDTENRVIVGYDTYNTILYDPATGEQDYYGLQDSTALFESAGNIFIGYMDALGAPSREE